METRAPGTVRNAANSHSEFSKHTTIKSKLNVYDVFLCPEGPAQPVKEPPDEEDHLPQTSKKQATSATATFAETSTSRGTLDELAEQLGNFHARALASCLQKQDVTP